VSDDQSAEALDLPGSVRDGKVIEGRHGRLFLANDANRVLDQHSGDLRLAEDKLRQWRHLLETRTAWLERRGSRHYFLIAPDAHSVYPESLPAGLPVAAERPVHQLLAHLREHDSYARVVYPLEAMLATGDEHLFAKTGSHWTSLGAFHAYRPLAEELRRDVAIEPVALDAYELVELDYAGDLGAKVDPVAWSKYIRLDPRAARARLVSDNRVRNTGRRIEYEGDAQAKLSCMVYGDSFAVRVIPFLAEGFRRLTFVHMSNLDFDLVRTLRPDVVVDVTCEHFLVAVPVDMPGKTQAEYEAERLAVGDLMPPRPRLRPGRPVPQQR
jgi:hypothetical protein